MQFAWLLRAAVRSSKAAVSAVASWSRWIAGQLEALAGPPAASLAGMAEGLRRSWRQAGAAIGACLWKAAGAPRPERGGPDRKAGLGPGSTPEEQAGTAPISASQLSFLSSLVGLSIAVASADGLARLREVDALKRFFRESFPYAEEDQRLLGRLVDRTYLARDRLAVDELAGHFVGASTPAGRRLLVRLLLKIAATGGAGVPPRSERLIHRIARKLGLTDLEYEGLAAESLPPAGWEYRVLGLEASADEEEVRSAYRRLASECHPDRFSSLGLESVRAAEERFKVLQEAYEELRRKRGLQP
jgi:DnaJ like chaperone protein